MRTTAARVASFAAWLGVTTAAKAAPVSPNAVPASPSLLSPSAVPAPESPSPASSSAAPQPGWYGDEIAFLDGIGVALVGISILLDPADGSLLTVDLLLAGEELLEVFRTRMTVPWRGRTIAVVTREGLAIIKRLASGRPEARLARGRAVVAAPQTSPRMHAMTLGARREGLVLRPWRPAASGTARTGGRALAPGGRSAEVL